MIKAVTFLRGWENRPRQIPQNLPAKVTVLNYDEGYSDILFLHTIIPECNQTSNSWFLIKVVRTFIIFQRSLTLADFQLICFSSCV